MVTGRCGDVRRQNVNDEDEFHSELMFIVSIKFAQESLNAFTEDN